MEHQLAQVNIARMRAPLDSPLMAGFVAQLEPLNALAEASAGFVWRLQTPAGDATSIQAFADPLIIVNMSVWESADALQQYVYRSSHVGALRDRQQWFEKLPGPHYALWWIPAGHQPTVTEAKERLDILAQHGPSARAFNFPHLFSAGGEPLSRTGEEQRRAATC